MKSPNKPDRSSLAASTLPQSKLFRAQALESATGQPFGTPFGSMPMGWAIIAFFLVTITVAVIAFLLIGVYARKETAPGVLRAIGGETRIAAQSGGLIRALYVTDGQVVEKGQVIALIGTEQVLPGGHYLDHEVLAGIDSVAQSVAIRVGALEAAAPLEMEALRAERARILADRGSALAREAAAQSRLGLAQERLRAAEELSRQGYLPADQMRQRQADVIATDEARAMASEEIRGLDAQLEGLMARMAKVPHDTVMVRAQLDAQASQLRQERAQVVARNGYELRAPASGRVSALQASIGQTVDPSKPLMTLTPEAGRLRAEIYVPSRAIGFVRAGQRVRLLYDAYPYQKFGPAWGKVSDISATVLAPQEVGAVIQTSEPVFRVVVELDRQSIQAFGEHRPLSAGMALTADVLLEERSFAEWLLEPIFALHGRMQRPPELRSSI